MPTVPKVLGQAKPGAASLTIIYTVPAATNATVSTLIVSNQSATPTTFRVSIAVAGAADAPEQYIYYNIEIPGAETFAATIGVTLAATDVVRVYNTDATCSFSLFGVETT